MEKSKHPMGVATCAFGLESLVEKELRQHKVYTFHKENGRVYFENTPENIAKANFYLRNAERVLIELTEFECTDFDDFFDKIQSLPFEKYLKEKDYFPVQVKSSKSQLHGEIALQKLAKKAIANRLMDRYATGNLPENSDTVVETIVSFNQDICRVSLNTSGQALFKRGYRIRQGEAPLKETLASSLIQLSNWDAENEILVDPMCGSGTILFEAILHAYKLPAGFNRDFSCEYWDESYKTAFEDLRKLPLPEPPAKTPSFLGFDQDEEVIEKAKFNLANLQEIYNLQFNVKFQNLNLTELSLPNNKCTIITNPPYGGRLEDQSNLNAIYKKLNSFISSHPDLKLNVITGDANFVQQINKKPLKNRKLYNGKIKCYYYSYA